MQRAILMLALTTALGLPVLAATQQRTARVAKAQVVRLADSEKTTAQWAAMRPNWEALRPGKTH
ncbi:MAG: hypothetical protein D6727_10050 [Gammaproteobacteria bacterium]|nr:MAG: hypothetical protein D6727_10050 [Gammaproteobacteria bacterium]